MEGQGSLHQDLRIKEFIQCLPLFGFVNGFFAHHQVVQNVFMLLVVSIDAKLTLGSFFPVISLHKKWEGKIKSKISAREQ